MMLDKSKNENPRFSHNLVPIHIWIMNTTHNIDIAEVKNDLSFVPKAILEKMLAHISKEDGMEAHIYVVAHDKEADVYKVYLGHAWGENEKKGGAFSNLQRDAEGKEETLQGVKLNELHIQYRPDWNGKREEPITKDVTSLEEAMAFLEETKMKELFLRVFPNTQTSESPVTALTPSPITKKEAKPPKMTKAKRDALVKRFGEDKIKELEARMGLTNKKNGNKKGKAK